MRAVILLLLLSALTGCSISEIQSVLDAMREHNITLADMGSLRRVIEPSIWSDLPPVALWGFVPTNFPGEECLVFLELNEQAGLYSYDHIPEVDATCYEVVDEDPRDSLNGWGFMEKAWEASDGETYSAIFGPIWQADFATIEATWRDDFVASAEVTNGAFLIVRPGSAELRYLVMYDSDGGRVEQFDVPVWPE